MPQRSNQLGLRRSASRPNPAHHGRALPPVRSGLDRGVGKEPRAGTKVMSRATTAWCPTRRSTARLQALFLSSTDWSTKARSTAVLLFARGRVWT